MKGAGVLVVTLVALAAYLLQRSLLAKKDSDIVTCPDGQLIGSTAISRDGREYFGFLGVPYAKPPVGELRFESPIPFGPWEGVRRAQDFGSKCPQLDLLFAEPTGDEDCLFLNVYTPKLPSNSENVSLPVLVFFHGGAFVLGDSNGYRGDYFMDEDVVLVTVNYRLASFGFLNTGDGVVRGNMGLKDQTMSLKWVQRNIRSFGGDPDKVTIFGESAGAASVHLHYFSRMSAGLFHRGISQSGSALSPWMMQSNPAKQAKRFCEKLNCPTASSIVMFACMKKLSVQEILTAHKEVMVPLRDFITVFIPTIDSGETDENTFLTALPRDLLKLGQYANVPWMAGATKEDGLIFSSGIIRNETVIDLVYKNFEQLMPNILMSNSDSAAGAKLREKFLLNRPSLSDPASLSKLIQIFTQRSFFNGIIEATEQQAGEGSPVHLFQYSYKGEFRPANILIAIKRRYPVILEFAGFLVQNLVRKYLLGTDAPFYGVGHADELSMFFYMPWLAHVGRGHEDYPMSKAIVKLWASYAYGRPLELMDTAWPLAGKASDELKFLNISLTPEVIDNPFKEDYKFWTSLNLAPNL